jgi:hypothetical protein
MIFTVNADNTLGIAGFARDTAKSALEKALELLRDGKTDVSITAPDGEVYAHDKLDEFARKYEANNANSA